MSALTVSERFSYDSYYSANELLKALSDELDQRVTQKLQVSPTVTVLADESTDLSNKKRMVMHALVVSPELEPSTVFLRDIEYESGTGEGLSKEILQEVDNRNIPVSKLMGFGSDGASVMSGTKKGVLGQILDKNPHCVHVHCMAHRLALCTSQAAKSINQLNDYQETLTSLFYYFKKSATRAAKLVKVQELLDSPQLKYKEIHAVRWMSFFDALQTVYRTLDALLSYLASADAQKDPKAVGLRKKIANQQFLHITYLMMDVIPIVTKLCLTFQKQDLDISRAKVAVDQCCAALEAYKSAEGQTHLKLLDEHLQNGTFKGQHHITGTPRGNLQSLKDKFVDKLLDNINNRFPDMNMVSSFTCLALRPIHSIPDEDLDEWGYPELETLINHYGLEKERNGIISKPLIDPEITKQEWKSVKRLVKVEKFPVNSMVDLWGLIMKYHKEELPNLALLVACALTLPIHTAQCERSFSVQNLILTNRRNRLLPVISDRLMRVKIEGGKYGAGGINYSGALKLWRASKHRMLMNKSKK